MTRATIRKRFRKVAAGAVVNGLNRESTAERVADALAEEAERCLPTLVSRTAVAELLGVHKANIGRYEEQIKPFEVVVEGARAPVYVKSGIEALAKTLHG